MKRKKRGNNTPGPKSGRFKITPAAIVGILIGLAVVVAGLHPSPDAEPLAGYYMIALGAVFIILVLWMTVRGKK
ncbi:MAG: hypothetical protein GY859_39845 [Desulfobacterales bacterium]|nr:hypothetical protein [Desulfobacterales bacterium]